LGGVWGGVGGGRGRGERKGEETERQTEREREREREVAKCFRLEHLGRIFKLFVFGAPNCTTVSQTDVELSALSLSRAPLLLARLLFA